MGCTHLLYLHGFRSSPRSSKAVMLADRLAAMGPARPVWACPQLPPDPIAAMALIDGLTQAWPTEDMAVIGSSLGGFYATVLAERRGCRAVVINPAVAPARDLARHIGLQTSWYDPQDAFFFQPSFIDGFRALDPYPITRPDRYRALIAEGDEVLDAREMKAAYATAPMKVLPGSDHAVSDFADHLSDLLEGLGLPA